MQSLKYLRHRLQMTGYLIVHISGHLHRTRTITKRTSLAYSARKVQMFFWMSFKNFILLIFFIFSTSCSLLFLAAFQSPLIAAKWCWQISYFIFLLSSFLLFSFEFFVVNDIVSWHQVYFLLSSIPSARSFAFIIEVEESSLRYRTQKPSQYARRPFCLA